MSEATTHAELRRIWEQVRPAVGGVPIETHYQSPDALDEKNVPSDRPWTHFWVTQTSSRELGSRFPLNGELVADVEYQYLWTLSFRASRTLPDARGDVQAAYDIASSRLRLGELATSVGLIKFSLSVNRVDFSEGRWYRVDQSWQVTREAIEAVGVLTATTEGAPVLHQGSPVTHNGEAVTHAA